MLNAKLFKCETLFRHHLTPALVREGGTRKRDGRVVIKKCVAPQRHHNSTLHSPH